MHSEGIHEGVRNGLLEHRQVVEEMVALEGQIQRFGDLVWETLRNGGKVLLCGNGGSAADAQHLAAEFVGRFVMERQGLAAIALTTDTSALTAIANDYGFERVFARQVEALGRKGDLLVAISTSGKSPNVLAAAQCALDLGISVVALTGANPGALGELANLTVAIPSRTTARIQEMHILVGHLVCSIIDQATGHSARLTIEPQ